MAPRQGDRKNRGNPEVQQASDSNAEPAQASPERRDGRRRGGRKKEPAAAAEQAPSPDRQKKRGRGKTGELQRAGQPAPKQAAESDRAEPVAAEQTPAVVAEPEAAPIEAAPIEAAPIEAAPIEAAPIEAAPIEAAPAEVAPAEAAPPGAVAVPDETPPPASVAPAREAPPPQSSSSELTPSPERVERRSIPPSIPAPPPSARAPGFHVITEGPPKLNRTEPPVPTLRTGEAPMPRDLPGSLTRALAELPTAFSAFSNRWNRAGSDTGRVLAIAAGIDASARLLSAAWLGLLSRSPRARSRTEAGNAIVSRSWYRRELPASSWMQMNFRLASIVAREPDGVLGEVARALADAGGLADDLCKALEDLGPNAAGDAESLLVDLFGSLLSLCRPLREVRLLAFAGRSIIAGEGEARWMLREMRGLSPSSEMAAEWHSGPIAPGSCHLILPDSCRIALAPLLSAQRCLDCQSLEVHAADMLVFGASERAVRCLRCARSSKDRSVCSNLRALDSSVRVWSAV